MTLSEPIAPSQRNELIDALRGFALFGVAVANMLSQSGFNASRPEHLASPVDRWAFSVVLLLIAGKFISLFSLLFGLGFGLQLQRAESAGRAFVPRYVRRLGVLFLIGILHHILLSTGDILKDYAILGGVLLLFRNASTRTLLIAAGLSMFVPTLVSYLLEQAGIGRPAGIDPALTARVITNGSYMDRTLLHANSLPGKWWVLVTSNSYFFVMFLCGYYAARRHLLDESDTHHTAVRRIFWAALAIGIIARAASPVLEPAIAALHPVSRGFASSLLGARTLALAVAYGAGFALLWRSLSRVRRTLAPLADLGRMALTNYVMVSVIGTFLFFGLRLQGTMPAGIAISMGIVVWTVQLVWSRWWLARFRYGPLEWCWRTLTYGRIQPMKKSRATLASDTV